MDDSFLKAVTTVLVVGMVALAIMSISAAISCRPVVTPCEYPKIVATQGEVCCKGLPKHDYEMTDAEKVQYKVHIYRKTEPAATTLPIEKK